jgi:uncharacterized membrane protein YccC
MGAETSRSVLREFLHRNALGLHYAVRIFLGTAFLWLILGPQRNTQPIWAVISMIFVTEPILRNALEAFRYRLMNTALGCIVGLLFLGVLGPHDWLLPLAVMVTAFTATFLPQSATSWRTAPIAAAIVLASGLTAHSKAFGVQVAGQRAIEVFLGGVTALCITWLLSRIWMPEDAPHEPASPRKPE